VRPLAALQHGGKKAAALFEEAAIAHRQIALSREVVGDKNVVAVEFDVPITDLVDLDLSDGRAVDQVADRDEHFATKIDADRMAGRNVKVLRGPVQAERVLRDSDRKYYARIDVRPTVDDAMTLKRISGFPSRVAVRGPAITFPAV
jgi:hypothetical protein